MSDTFSLEESQEGGRSGSRREGRVTMVIVINWYGAYRSRRTQGPDLHEEVAGVTIGSMVKVKEPPKGLFRWVFVFLQYLNYLKWFKRHRYVGQSRECRGTTSCYGDPLPGTKSVYTGETSRNRRRTLSGDGKEPGSKVKIGGFRRGVVFRTERRWRGFWQGRDWERTRKVDEGTTVYVEKDRTDSVDQTRSTHRSETLSNRCTRIRL